MNKFLKITMLAAIPLWGLTSCLDDNKYAYFHPNESWGTIVGTPENFKIETDNGNTLRVTENLDPSFPVEDSLRVVATFTPLEQTGENSFDIRVNAMKKLLTTALLALTAALTAGAQSRTEVYTFPSEVLGAEKSCTVYLPDGYDRSQESYPVLYLLHGASGCHTDWTQKGDLRRIADEAIAAGMARPMIVVMPDASGEGPKRTGRHMGYFDVPGWDYERFFFEEFMPAVEKRYRIASDKAHRAVVGLSMGGGGTAVYALRHPELFGSACSMSGLLDMFPGRRSYDNAFQQSVADNSPVALLRGMTAEQLDGVRSVRWWVDCGDDDFLWKCNVDFYTLMRERGIPLQYRMRDGGHTWRYWQTVLPDALTFVSNGFGK